MTIFATVAFQAVSLKLISATRTRTSPQLRTRNSNALSHLARLHGATSTKRRHTLNQGRRTLRRITITSIAAVPGIALAGRGRELNATHAERVETHAVVLHRCIFACEFESDAGAEISICALGLLEPELLVEWTKEGGVREVVYIRTFAALRAGLSSAGVFCRDDSCCAGAGTADEGKIKELAVRRIKAKGCIAIGG